MPAARRPILRPMHIEMEQIEGRRFRIKARGLELIVDDTIEAGGPGDGFRPSELLMGALAPPALRARC